MPDPPKPPPRVSLRLDNLSAALQQKLENEATILDLLLSALARGQAQEPLWDQLHEAAARDDRLAELAFAYERLSRDKKLKSLNPTAQTAFLVHAGTFFHDVFSDPEGSEPYFERAFALLPAELTAFQKLEALYASKKDNTKLGDLYAAAAPHRDDRAEQLRLLRHAAELLTGSAAPDKLIKLHQEILRLDPTDATARRALEERYERAGRFGDLAKLLEQTLAADPPPPEAQTRALHSRLITLYAGLRELERALPHVEEILRIDPAQDAARAIASELLTHKALAARAASILAGAHERTGQLAEAAKMLNIEIEQLRGPRRVESQKRLANLYYERFGDLQKTFSLDEAIVPLDPADHDVRARFIKIGSAIEKHADLIRVLSRASSSTKDPAVRARIGADLGDVLLATGDGRKARVAYQGVVDARADDTATLRAGRALAAICVEAKDHKTLAAVLARLGDVEPDDRERAEVTLRLARLSEDELRDIPGAIAAYRRLLDTSLHEDAIAALERLFELAADYGELVPILDLRVRAERDPERARDIAFRAADIRSTKLTDRAAALAAWRAYVEAHGCSREVLARLIPLLEQEKRWEDLAAALAEDAALAPEAERAPILARLGQVRLGRLGDPRGALEAHRRALQIDPAERQSRLAIDKMLAAGDLRLAAADVLEPLVRAEGAAAALVRVLETRAALSDALPMRLAALAEAAEVANRDLRDPKRGIELAGRGLELAIEGAEGEAPGWIALVERLSAAPADAGRGAAALAKALGERDTAPPILGLLARRTGEALVRSGDVAGALAVFRRALASEPSSSELLARVDDLLREQGSPEERIALYRAALSGAEDPTRRREVLHSIGAIERRDLGDRAAAVATYQQALREDPSDNAAFVALTELHEDGGEWEVLYELLRYAQEREVSHGDGDGGDGDERIALTRRIAELSAAHGWLGRAASHYGELLSLDGALADDTLTAIEKAARATDDLILLRAVFERRVAIATDPADESAWLERLGDLEGARLGRHDAAAAAFSRAAEAAALAGDRAQAQRLYERVLGSAIDDRVAAERLYALYREGGAWDRIPGVVLVLLRTSPSAEDAARVLLSFEGPAMKAGATTRFVEEASALLRDKGAELTVPLRAALRAALATVTASDPARQPEAALAYRAILESGEGDLNAAVQAFEAFLAPRGVDAAADRRWLFAWRVEHAEPGEQISVLLAWADAEERSVGDPAAAAELYERVIALDPEHDAALAARARLLLSRGDVEGAVAVLTTRRDRAEGSARDALDQEIAALLLTQLDRPGDALLTVAPQLENAAPDGDAFYLVRGAVARLCETGDAETLVRAAERLEGAALSTAMPEVRAALYEVLLSTPSSLEELRDARRGWFERLLEAPGIPPAEVLDIALRAVSELPEDISVWERAERLAREADGGVRVAEAYRRALAGAKARPPGGPVSANSGGPYRLLPEAIEELGRRAVDFHEEWFDDAEAVVKLLRRTVELVPTSTWAFERLKLTYNLGERWEELFQLYDETLAETEDAMTRRDLLEDAALAAKDLAGDTNRAMRYLEDLLAIRDEPRHRTALERLYERHGKTRPLIALLGRQLRGLTGEPAQALRARIAGLWLEGAGEPSSAVVMIERMIDAEPDRGEAFDLLERVMAATSAAPRSAEDAEARQRAAVLLQARYKKQGRTEDLARVLEIELEGQKDPKERAERLRALVELRLTALGDEAGAFEGVAALVLLEPADAEHRAELTRLAQKLGREGRLAEVLAAAAELAEPPLRIELLFQAATVYRERQRDAERAIALYRATLKAAPERDPLSLASARELDRLLAEGGQPAERCDVLEILSTIEPEATARRSARAELARLAWESADDPERAIRAFRAAIAEDPRDADALAGVIRALEELGRWRELIEVLEHRASGKESEESAEARRDRVRVAQIHDERLGDPDQAIAVYRAVRGEGSGDDETADALAALLEKTGRWDELSALLEREALSATSGERAADLFRRAGDLHRERTRRLGDAIASYELALERRPGDAGARSGLEALVELLETELAREAGSAEQRSALVAAVALLVRLYAEADDWERTVRLLEPRLIAAEAAEAQVAILTETAGLLEGRRGDAAGAFDAIWRAFLLVPGAELAARALRLASASQEADRFGVIAAALDEGLAERADIEKEVARDLFWSVALWQRDRRADFAAAEVAIERALERDPASVEMLEALAEVQRRAPSRKLIDTLLRLAASRGGGLEHYREAVIMAEGPVADRALARSIAEKLLDAAVASWPAAADLQVSRIAPARGASAAPAAARLGVVAPPGPSVPPVPAQRPGGPPREAQAASWAIEALVRLTEEEGSEKVVDLYLRGAKLPFDVAERRRLRALAADLAELEQKIAIYEELFDEDPNDALPTERLDAIYREHDRKADLIRLRERQIAAAKQAAPRVGLRFELAGLLAASGDATQAIAVLRQNLSVTPSHPPSIAKLAELLEEGGHYQDLVALCEDQAGEAETEGNRESAANLWGKAAALAEGRLGDDVRAITDHHRASALGSSESADALARLLTRRGEHSRAAEVLEKLCERASPEALAALALRLMSAHLAAGNAPAARARLERYIPLAREGEGLRERLANLYREAEEWGPLAALIAESAGRAGDPKARAARLREAADLYLQRIHDPARAVPLLEQAAALAPEDTPLRRQLAASLNAAGRSAEAADVLTTLLASYGTRRPKDRALAHYELARVLGTTDRARASAELDLALRIDPGHPEVLAMLARLSLEDGQLDRAARTFRALLLVVRKPREEAGQAAISRTEVLIELAEIARLQGDAARAAEYLDSAFEAARESDEEGLRLLATLRARKSYDTLATALTLRLEGVTGAAAAPILDELAELYDAHLGRAPEALDARLSAFTLAPPTAAALGSTLGLAVRTEQLPRFVEVVSRLAEEETDKARSIELFLVLGGAHDREGGDLRRAAEAYRAAEARLEADADGARLRDVWRALDRIYGALGDVDATAALMEKQINHADDPREAADPLHRLAAIRLVKPETEAAGIALLDRAMDADAQPDRAEAALRAALSVSPESAPLILALLRLAREAGRDRTLIDALLLLWDHQDKSASAPPVSLDPSRFDGLKEAMEIARRVGDQALVEEILRRALERPAPEGDGVIAWALMALADLREAEGKLAEAVTLRERAARASGPEEERALLLSAAVISAGPLGDLPLAARLYEELRAREPAEREVWQPLIEVYRKLGDRARLGALLDETAPLLDSADERARLRLARAQMSMVDDEPKAIELLNEIVSDNPNEVEAAKLLLDLLEKHGKKEEQKTLLARQIDAAKDREDIATIVPLSIRLGALLEGDWDEQSALDVYHAALDWAPKSREMLKAIVRINMTREDSVDLGDAMGRLLEVEEGEPAAELALSLARLRADDPEGAERALEQGYAACPTSAALKEELAQRYAASEAWKKLSDLHVRDAESRASAEEQIEGLCQAAEILRGHGDPGGAAEILLRALSLDLSERDVLLALIDAYTAANEHTRAVEAIGMVLSVSPEDPWLYRSRASLYDALGRDDLALDDLEVAYAKSGGGYASELVVQIEKSVQAAARELTVEGRAKERTQRLHLADVLAKAGAIDRARAESAELTRTDGKDRAALRALAALEDAGANWDAAIATYRRLLPLEDGDALSEIALRLADACEKGERLGDARSALERALAQRAPGPSRSAVRERLRVVYNATGAARELAGMVLEDAAAAPSSEPKFPLLIRAARLLLDAGGEGPRTVLVLEEARGLVKAGSPDDQEATPLLAEAYASAGRIDDARALLDAAVAAHKGKRSKQLSAIHRQRARIELGLGDNAAGLAALQKALDNDPQNGALAMELGMLAVELDDYDVQNRAFRAVTMMKLSPSGGADGTSAAARGLAYYHLGRVAVAQGDRRKARLMVEKAVADDPALEEARALLEQLRAGA